MKPYLVNMIRVKLTCIFFLFLFFYIIQNFRYLKKFQLTLHLFSFFFFHHHKKIKINKNPTRLIYIWHRRLHSTYCGLHSKSTLFFVVTNINIPSSWTQIGKNPKASRGEKEKNKMIKWEDERAEMPEYWTWRDWRVIQQVLDNWIIRLQMVLLGDSNTLKFNSNTNPELISGTMGVARRQQFISYTRATVTGLRFKTLQYYSISNSPQLIMLIQCS